MPVLNTYYRIDGFYSKHFRRSQFEHGIQGGPIPAALDANLRALCEAILEPIVTAWGEVEIVSGYRPRDLASAHSRGLAADIQLRDRSKRRIDCWGWILAEFFAGRLPIDRAVLPESDGYIHVAHAGARPARGEFFVRENIEDSYDPRYVLWSDYLGPLRRS